MNFTHGIFSLRLFIFLFFLPTTHCLAQQKQVPVDTTCIQKDLADLIRKKLDKPPKVKSDSTNSLLLVPIIGSNPATGFMIGIGGQYAFKMSESKLYSFISGSIQATTKSQYLLILKNNIYSKHDRIFYTGDWRFLIFSQSTYGLGTNSPNGGVLDYQYSLAGAETSTDSLAQPMEYNFARLHQSMGFKIAEGFYLGAGYMFDLYSKIVDEKLRLNPGDTLITSHYAYNTNFGFDLESYYSSAMGLSFTIDKRDNMIQAHKGYFLSLGFNGAYTILGNKNNANIINLEWRSFYGISKRNPAHLFALWALGYFTKEGDFPYMILPATAYDQRSRSARGYTQGRFRGSQYVYTEGEYRFPISRCGGILSGVAFVNGTTCTNESQDLRLFDSIKAGYGAGLRIMLDKSSRTNLALDYGFGDNSSGFYFAIAETF